MNKKQKRSWTSFYERIFQNLWKTDNFGKERNQLYFEQLKKNEWAVFEWWTNELEIYVIIEGWNTNI